MYTLYGSPGSASFLPHCVLEEVGAPYRLHPIDMSKSEQTSPAYLALNPHGKIPALGFPDGAVMWECAAIAMYLADQYPQARLAPALNDPLRAFYYQWMTHLTNSLQVTALRFYYPHRITTDSNGKAAVAEKAAQDVADLWTKIEKHLNANGPYMLGKDFSVPDIFVQMLSTWQEVCPDLYVRFPAVKRLSDLVSARPAILRIIEAHKG